MGKEIFLKECAALNIDADKFFEFQISGQTKSKRYVGRSKSFTLVAEYFILYLKYKDIWIAWKREKGLDRRCFSIDKQKVDNLLKTKMETVNKNVQFSSWGEENVYVFKTDEIKTFLEHALKESV